MTRDDAIALLDRRRDVLASRDMTAFASLYESDATLESPLAGSVAGREAIVGASEAFFAAFPDAVIAEAPAVIDGDRAVIIAEVTGTHDGTIMGLAPTGRPFRFPMAFVLELGRTGIARERRIYDFTGLLVQIGVLKAKPA